MDELMALTYWKKLTCPRDEQRLVVVADAGSMQSCVPFSAAVAALPSSYARSCGCSGELPAPSATAGTGMLVSGASRLLPGPCIIHIQCTFVQQSAVEGSDRFFSIFRIGHFHKPEPA